MRNGGQYKLRDALEHDMWIQSDQTCSGQLTSGQCRAGGHVRVGQQEHGKCSRDLRYIPQFFFNFCV